MMSHLKLDMWQSEGTSSLDPNLDQIWLGGGKEREGDANVEKREGKEGEVLERECLPSL